MAFDGPIDLDQLSEAEFTDLLDGLTEAVKRAPPSERRLLEGRLEIVRAEAVRRIRRRHAHQDGDRP